MRTQGGQKVGKGRRTSALLQETAWYLLIDMPSDDAQRFSRAATPLTPSDQSPPIFKAHEAHRSTLRTKQKLVQVSQCSMCLNENPQLSTVSLGDNSQAHRQTCCILCRSMRRCIRTVNPHAMPTVFWFGWLRQTDRMWERENLSGEAREDQVKAGLVAFGGSS